MNLDDKEASLIADLRTSLSTQNTNGHKATEIDENKENSDEDHDDKTKKSKKRKLNGTNRKNTKSSEASESRRESHKIIEQKRRQKINTKINELRELLNCPDSAQNKAVVLAAAVENIKNLKVVCSKLLAHHRQLQEEYMQVLQENEALKKIQEQQQQTHFSHTTPSDKNGSVLDPDRQLAMLNSGTLPQPLKTFYGVENNAAFRLPEIPLPGSTNSGLGLLGNIATVGNLGSLGNALYEESALLSGSNRTAQPLGVPGSEGAYPLNSMVVTDPLAVLHQTYNNGGENPQKMKDNKSIF